MTKPDFVYTTFIKTTPEKLWEAITNPEFARQYWAGNSNISDWKKGASWQHVAKDKQTIRVVGEVVECNPPKRLVLTWAEPNALEDTSRVTFDIEPLGETVQLTVIHGDFADDSALPAKISKGWPRVLSSLKSYLETGKPLDIWGESNSCGCTETKAA